MFANPVRTVTVRTNSNSRKSKLPLQIVLGAVVLISITAVILGLSILLGALKTPYEDTSSDQGQPAETQATGTNTTSLPANLFPHESEHYRAVLIDGTVVVYLYPSSDMEGTIDSKIAVIQEEVIYWLSENGVTLEVDAIDWRTK
jgi:hypothetical protein